MCWDWEQIHWIEGVEQTTGRKLSVEVRIKKIFFKKIHYPYDFLIAIIDLNGNFKNYKTVYMYLDTKITQPHVLTKGKLNISNVDDVFAGR